MSEYKGTEINLLPPEVQRAAILLENWFNDKNIKDWSLYGVQSRREYPSGTELRVCMDVTERQRKGLEKYGVSVADAPLTEQQWRQHLYEELLDAAVYLKRLMEENK